MSDETEQGIRRAKRAAEGSGYSGAPATRRLIALDNREGKRSEARLPVAFKRPGANGSFTSAEIGRVCPSVI